jgi:hypothetical protein
LTTKPVAGDKKDYYDCAKRCVFWAKNHRQRYGCPKRNWEIFG